MRDMRRIEDIFKTLIGLPSENEWVEFKEAKRQFSFEELGQYFSALSNEANLGGQMEAWLIFGVANKRPRKIVGTAYRASRPELESLKQEVSMQTSGRISFIAIHELVRPEGRVLLFEIPPAPRGNPVSWKGHYYGRNGESLCALSMEEIERIRRQHAIDDWTAEPCPELGLEDLDSEAITFARKQFVEKNPKMAHLDEAWDAMTFLNKARLSKDGVLSKAAVLLLGKPESVRALSPVVPRISWILKDKDGVELDYRHFEPPFILAVEVLFGTIRNLTYRYMQDESLFPVEISQYDPWVIRETLFNALAHQDYRRGARISFIESPDSLIVSNAGEFLPGSIENVVTRDAPTDQYRNPWLAQAMVSLNMIDTIGSGIRRVLLKQKERFFPMPDYDLLERAMVKVRIFGRIVDENFTRLLIAKPDLGLLDVLALDKVQKRVPLSAEEFSRLKGQKLIEGKRTRAYVSSPVAAMIGAKAAYIRNRAFDDEHYKALVLSFLVQYGEGKRADFEKLLTTKLSDVLDSAQKKKKIGNLLQEMAKSDGTIYADGNTTAAVWKLTKKGAAQVNPSQ